MKHKLLETIVLFACGWDIEEGFLLQFLGVKTPALEDIRSLFSLCITKGYFILDIMFLRFEIPPDDI